MGTDGGRPPGNLGCGAGLVPVGGGCLAIFSVPAVIVARACIGMGALFPKALDDFARVRKGAR